MAHLHSMHTHTCGELRAANVGQEVKLTGWVDRRRDLGQLIFVTILDREGMTQVIFDPDLSGEAFQTAETIRPEWPILVSGTVRHRIEGQTNEHMATGEIEVLATGITVLNTSVTPPFPIDDSTDTAEDIRLRYRYLDLRRPVMNKNLRLRSDFTFALREAFHANAFTEVETPSLFKSTPEGARDFLVPSRTQPGHFYAPARRPPARVHAGGRRDVLRRGRRCDGHDRGRAARRLRARGRGHADPAAPHLLLGRDGHLRH